MPRLLGRERESLPKRQAGFIQPMECALVSKLPEGADWTYEVKLDGYRVIGVKSGHEATVYSRNGKNFNQRYPYLAEAIGDLPVDSAIDGEVDIIAARILFMSLKFAMGLCWQLAEWFTRS